MIILWCIGSEALVTTTPVKKYSDISGFETPLQILKHARWPVTKAKVFSL